MTRRSFQFLLCAFYMSAAFAVRAATRMTVEETKLPGGITKVQRYIDMNNARINLLYHTRDGKTAINKRWGDHMFGLDFGRVMNGSWSAWQFFSCLEWSHARQMNLCCMGTTLPTMVAAFDVRGVAMADFVYPAVNPGTTLKIRMMQFPSHPTWFFVRMRTEDYTPWRIDFYLYPGGANDPPDREHWLGTPGGHFNLELKDLHLQGTEKYVVFYNKYVQNRDGNFLIFQPEKYNDVSFPRANGQGTTVEFRPKDGFREFCFGLGYFRDQPAQAAADKFLIEDGDAIQQFMANINWNPILPEEDMIQSCLDASQLGIPQEILDDFLKKFRAAGEKMDTATAAGLLEKLENMKEKKARDGLKLFGK